jgi:hypothetical protein
MELHYTPVSPLVLLPEHPLEMDLFLSGSTLPDAAGSSGSSSHLRVEPPALWLKAGNPLPLPALRRLTQQRNTHLWTQASQLDGYRTYLRFSLSDWLDGGQPHATLESILAALCAVTHIASRGREMHRLLEDADLCSRAILACLAQFRFQLREFWLQFPQADAYVGHAVRVGFYAALLARELDAAAEAQHRIAAAAWLHDCGKLWLVSPAAGPRHDQGAVRRELERHPRIAYDLLCERPEVSGDQLLMIYQHHERVDARGYPAGLPERLIHPWAKLCAVVNMFDHLQSAEMATTGFIDAVPLGRLNAEASGKLDQEMLRCWGSIVLQRMRN